VLQAGRSRVRLPMVSLEFFIDIILPAAGCSWGDSASKKVSTTNNSWVVEVTGA
jgi:hypothetical protein